MANLSCHFRPCDSNLPAPHISFAFLVIILFHVNFLCWAHWAPNKGWAVLNFISVFELCNWLHPSLSHDTWAQLLVDVFSSQEGLQIYCLYRDMRRKLCSLTISGDPCCSRRHCREALGEQISCCSLIHKNSGLCNYWVLEVLEKTLEKTRP